MKILSARLCLTLLLLCLTLTGCSASSPPSSPEPTSLVRWSPPDAPTASPVQEAASLIEALALCKTFSENTNALYPDYAPVFSAEDAAYYERQFGNPDADWNNLTAEMTQTIVNLRQQIYRKIENTRKMQNPLPDGLEEFVREYEARFRAIGW